MVNITLRIKLRQFFKSKPEIRLAYIFGSQATGRSNRMSDIDIAVWIDSKRRKGSHRFGYRAYLTSELMAVLKTNRVDVVLLNEISYFLRHRVISFGTPVYVSNEQERVLFEADIMSRYPDLKRLYAVHYG